MSEVEGGGELDIRAWLQGALRLDSAAGVDEYELADFERQVRSVLSRETDLARRAQLFAALRRASVGDLDFMGRLGAAAERVRQLLGATAPPLLYAGGELDKPSRVRGLLLGILAGEHFEDAVVFLAAQDLATAVPAAERALSIAQLQQALDELHAAHQRLPVGAPGRASERATSPAVLVRTTEILVLGLARLRQPAFTAALDALFTFDGATFARAGTPVPGLSRQAFSELVAAAKRSLQTPTDTTSKWDLAALWAGFEAAIREHLRGAQVASAGNRVLPTAEDRQLAELLARGDELFRWDGVKD